MTIVAKAPYIRSKVRALPWIAVLLATPCAEGLAQTVSVTQAQAADEIIVTARRRTEALRNVPVQATSIPGDRLAEFDLTSIEKISGAIPQLAVGRASSGSGARLTLRGIGASPTSIGIEQSVAVVVDGVYFGHGRILNEGFFDLERVEVLRGPQALFFGKNATGGVIAITTANPTDAPSASLRGSYEFGAAETTAEAVLSTPLGGDVSARLSLRGSSMANGYFENRADALTETLFDVATSTSRTVALPAPRVRDLPAAREAAGRLTLQYAPSDRFEVLFKASGAFNATKGGGYNNVIFNCRTGFSSLNPATPCRREFEIYSNAMPQDIAASLPFAKDGGLYNDYRAASTTMDVRLQLEDLDLSVVSNYQGNRNTWAIAGDQQSSPTPTFATENSTWRAASTEIRARVTTNGPLTGLAGLYIQASRRDFDQWVSLPGLENSGASNPSDRYVGFSKRSRSDGRTVSPYAQLTWTPTTRIEATLGARYTAESKSSAFRQPYVNPAVQRLFEPDTQVVAEQSFYNVSPEASALWRPVEEITLYGALKSAYKSGGFSNSGILSTRGSLEDFVFGPERVSGAEAGAKLHLDGGRIQANVGIYDYRYVGLQIDFFNAVVFAFVTTNAGSARTRGIETDISWSPVNLPALTLRGSLNYNRAVYEDFLAPCFNGQTPAAGCTTVAEGGLPGQQLKGAPLALAPSWTSAFGFDYETAVADKYLLKASLQGRSSSDYLASGFGNPLSRQPAYLALDGRLAISARNEGWRIALLAKNLTNVFYLTSAADGPGTGRGTGTAAGLTSDQIGLVAPPRTISLEASRRF